MIRAVFLLTAGAAIGTVASYASALAWTIAVELALGDDLAFAP